MSLHKTPVREIESRITEEHLSIRSLLARMETVSDPHFLEVLLQQLRMVLEQHFNAEEGDEGFYSLVKENSPEYSDKVDRLLEEHHELLQEIGRVTKECKRCIVGPIAEIKKGRSRLIERIQQHELAEHEILTDALIEGLGK